MTITVSGAYGRDYKSRAGILADWNAGKDFTIRTLGHRSYINRQDAAGMGSITVRYQRDRKVTVIRIGADGAGK